MLCAENFVDLGEAGNADVIAKRCWTQFANTNRLQAVLVISYDVHADSCDVLWGYNLPVEAFNGAEKPHLLNAIKECFTIHPKPHVHAMKRGPFLDAVARLNQNVQEQYRMWFYPATLGQKHFVVLALPFAETGKALPANLREQLADIIITLDGCLTASEFRARFQITETFLREVGHDIASAIQASVAKVRNIADGRVTGGGISIKAKEVEQEIWNIFRIAESLSIVADPQYKVKCPEDFDLNLAVKTVCNHFKSEANERNLRLCFRPEQDPLFIWGEKPAIQQAIGQILFNAIKYSYGGNDISILTNERELDFVICISNKGHPLPEGDDAKRIWDFGFRGRRAKELHVNGSGIGLYTVKKVVTAHTGWVDASSCDGKTDFYIHLPKKAAMKRDLGLLL